MDDNNLKSEEQHKKGLTEANRMGKNRAEKAGGAVSVEYMTQSAEYANNVLPELRQFAGFTDASGRGTYTHCPCDEAAWRLDELVDAYLAGLRGDDYEA